MKNKKLEDLIVVISAGVFLISIIFIGGIL